MAISTSGDRFVTDGDRLKVQSVMHQVLQKQWFTYVGDRCDRSLHRSDTHTQERVYEKRVTNCHVSCFSKALRDEQHTSTFSQPISNTNISTSNWMNRSIEDED